MSSRPLIIIATHESAIATTLRHLPFWQACGETVLTCSGYVPRELLSACPATVAIGQPQYIGHDAIRRTRAIFAHAAKLMQLGDYSQCAISEYDWVSFRPMPPPPPDSELYAPLWNNGDPRFSSPVFAHPAWRMNPATLRAFAIASTMVPDDAEHGWIDRWIARVADTAAIRLVSDPLAYSRNELDSPQYIAEARACGLSGGWAVHGIKHPHQLNLVQPAFASP